MADLYLVIQSIMKFQKAMKKVDVLLKNSEKYTGIIKKFSGKQLLLEEMEINIDDIDLVEEHVELDLSVFIMNRVLITLDTAERVDAVLMSVDSEEISYITEDGLKTVEIERIAKILCEEQEVILKDIAIEENIPSIEKETTLGENEVICQEETSEIENGIYEPNAFEQGLIDGNKALVESYVEQSERLLSCGYTEKEVERIKKRYKILAWSMEPFKVATRIYEMQLNKNGLARQYYEIALEKSKIGSPEFVKTVNALVKLIVEDGDEQYVAFWKKYAMYLKDNVGYCNKFLETLLRLKKIKPNEFERLLIKGDKAAVMEYSGNEEALLDLEYTTDDIERILKALKIANWDNSWYRIAARLFCMQLNKNGLAEVYYEAALLVANEKGDEYTKILNALASVKALQNNDEYISFFDAYQEKLKSNANFCIAYANALLATQNLEKLEEKVPMLKEQLAGNPAYLGKLDAEINYYKTMPRFVLANIKVLSDRYENEAVHYEQEKALIEKLPERSALNTLLEIYFFNKEEAAYFALVEYALFFMKENKTAMLKLYTMLHATEDVGTIAHLLPKIPVLWCDADLVKKYMSVVTEEEDFSSTDINRQRLRQHIVSVGVYRTLNAFEIGIVNCDCNEVSRYSDDVSLLEELGYSDDEIEDISSVDVEAQLSGDIYAMRRILAFQGNKNHTAEKYLFEAFYNNKIDMCNRLFPLLLEEKRGELILGLFDFDPNLNSKMTSLQRFYYLALCIAEKDDSLFFDRMESEWMNFPEDEILDRMLKIAMEKGDELLIKQLELQKNRPRANEFETAIMEADSEAIRKFVKNANLLVELGYTPEEIQKISKIFEIGNTNSGTKPGQIANRVYLYQKNKNNLAERLYLNAIAEDSSEDVITDCKALFQIYTGQHNYEMVCKIYENYLYAEMEEKFNRTYAATY
ncbi:MAG: hypothetical protein IJX63_14650, partial [Lachnospiraceae bacterium]|nr:hypothetical protein [Lachnospiraceae bacterium]